MYWNNKGTNVLLLTSTETDKSGASYYGKQSLHFLSVTGDTAIVLMSELLFVVMYNFDIINIFSFKYLN